MTTTTTTQNATQTRGTCQCCGRDQAVVNGRMSLHGYTVEHGWFSGVCGGQRYAPLQESREQADRIVAQVRKDCEELDALAAGYAARTLTPDTVLKRSYRPGTPKTKPWEEASEWERREEYDRRAYAAEYRAKCGREFADDLEKLANTVHGTALRVVVKPDKAAPIRSGEQRRDTDGEVLTVVSVERARVYYTYERNGKRFKTWKGTQAWRKLPTL